jgi:hypothetical protein
MLDARFAAVNRYLDALGAGDFDTILSLFDPAAEVDSPLYGRMAARPFFAEFARTTKASEITVHDILLSPAQPRAAGHFHHRWTRHDGVRTAFECCVVCVFTPGNTFSLMHLLYDTAPAEPTAPRGPGGGSG